MMPQDAREGPETGIGRRWLKLLNPDAFDLPPWVETVRPLSHLAANCVTYLEPGRSLPVGAPDQVHVTTKVDLFGCILREGEFADWNSGSRPKTFGSFIALGAQPFKVVEIDGVSQFAEARGGWWLSPNVELGSCVAIERGIFGEFTEIGHSVKIGSHSYIGHSVLIGARTIVVPGTVIGGWAEIGHDAWLGMGCRILEHRKVGDHAYVGAGAIVTDEVPDFCEFTAYSSRGRRWRCPCGETIAFGSGTMVNCRCLRVFGKTDEGGLHERVRMLEDIR